MNIAICDDSVKDRNFIKEFCEKSNIVENVTCSHFSSGKDFLKAINNGQIFDILFLDVDMPGINGIETGKGLRQIDQNTIIIFITSYPEFALDAFECEAFHYLVKPCSPNKLMEVLKRAANRLGVMQKYHIVKIRNQTIRLPLADIYYVEYYRKHVIYHMKDEEIITIDKLSNVYKALSKFGFYQIHQGYLVNFDKVKNFKKYAVILDDDRSVMISVRKWSEVLVAYSKYVEDFTR